MPLGSRHGGFKRTRRVGGQVAADAVEQRVGAAGAVDPVVIRRSC